MKHKIVKIDPNILRELSKGQIKYTDTYYNFPEPIRNFYWKRLEKMLNIAMDISKNKGENKHVLDLGCGQGVLLPSLSKNFRKVSGIDLEIFSAEKIVDYFKLKNIELYKCNIFGNKLEKDSFDFIFAPSVLEHFPDSDMIINELKSLLNKSGILIFSSPTETKLYEFARKVMNVKKPDDHYHSVFEIIQTAKRYLELVKIVKMPYDIPFFPMSMSLHLICVFKKV